ncbi:MAG: TMEM175 family protein [Candidatus Tritonobacter lacicola]|nr:TMEM175 family protein [Candidatus Tritonobacter lacicola]
MPEVRAAPPGRHDRNMAEEKIITPHRLNAFSDGVFAIAITLMVLTLQLPDEAASVPINEALRLSVLKLEIWVISFLIIGGFWIRHHKLIQRIERVDMVLLWLNLFYLLVITAMPWLVSLIETYPGEPLAVTIFSGACGFMGLVKLSMWLYASHKNRLINPSISPREVKAVALTNLCTPVVAVISIAVAYTVSARLAFWCWLLRGVLGPLVSRSYKSGT